MSAVYTRSFQPMPVEVPALELVPLAPADQGFVGRLPPVTEADHIAADRALNAAKASPDWRAPSDHFSLQVQQQRGGGL